LRSLIQSTFRFRHAQHSTVWRHRHFRASLDKCQNPRQRRVAHNMARSTGKAVELDLQLHAEVVFTRTLRKHCAAWRLSPTVHGKCMRGSNAVRSGHCSHPAPSPAPHARMPCLGHVPRTPPGAARWPRTGAQTHPPTGWRLEELRPPCPPQCGQSRTPWHTPDDSQRRHAVRHRVRTSNKSCVRPSHTHPIKQNPRPSVGGVGNPPAPKPRSPHHTHTLLAQRPTRVSES
jgi:hypothetical protein